LYSDIAASSAGCRNARHHRQIAFQNSAIGFATKGIATHLGSERVARTPISMIELSILATSHFANFRNEESVSYPK
jgi:hypothetical protein